MKNLLILLVFSTSLCVVLSAKDYCDMEKRLCENEKHIGCDKNEFKNMESLYSLKLEQITNYLMELIVDKINTFRSLVATGKITQFETASNMRLVTWNSEMEYLSTLLVLHKLPWLDYACCKTDTNPKSSELHLGLNSILPTTFLTRAFEHMFNYSVKQKAASALDLSFFYSANLTSIGCAFGSYKNEGDKMILRCVQNEPEATSSAETYLPGEPCSHCSMYNQVCSEKYPGLCEDEKVSPVGPQGPVGPAGFDGAKGEKGEKGDRCPIGSIYFWVLYILMGCVVGVALFVAFRAKRSAQGFPSVAYFQT